MTTEATTNEATYDEAAEEAAFAAALKQAPAPAPAAAAEGRTAPAMTIEDAGTTPPPEKDEAPQSESTSTEQTTKPEADPFAGLPKAVRDLLAEVPALRARTEAAEQRAREFANRIPDLQSKVDRLLSTGKPADPAATQQRAPEGQQGHRLEKVEALRLGGLPEIADAIEELAARALKPEASPAPTAAPEPKPAAATAQPADPQAEVLDEIRPTWADDIEGTDFKLWLASQEPQYARTVMGTGKASVLLGALSKFDEFKAATATQSTTQTQTPNTGARTPSRMAAGLAPRGDGRRQPTRALTEEEAEAAAFSESLRKQGYGG